MSRTLVVLALGMACGGGRAPRAMVDVKRADLVIDVEVTGELAAVDSLDVTPPALDDQWDFKIAQLADEGAEVKPGDPVVAFDPAEQERRLESLQNEADAASKKLDRKRDDAALMRRDEALRIAEAEAKLRKATLKMSAPGEEVALVEQRRLELDRQLASRELEKAKNTASQTAQSDAVEIAQLAERRARLLEEIRQVEEEVARMNVAAPRAGTIVFPSDPRGNKTKVGDTVWRMETVLKLVSLDRMEGNGEIDEIDMARVRAGQPVSLALDALPDVQLRGRVASLGQSVAPRSKNDPSNVVRLKISLDATAGLPLRPGMRFRGKVEAERIPDVVQVPAEAVFVTRDGPVAYRASGADLVPTRLTLGRRSTTMIEVKAGLAPGERVSRVEPSRSAR